MDRARRHRGGISHAARPRRRCENFHLPEPRLPMDIAPLLAPVNADTPGGVDLSFSPEIDAIQEMRREDDPTLDQGEWVTELKSADWPGVARTCETILSFQSKDLRIAGWL